MKKAEFFEDDGLDYEDMLSNFDDFCDQFEKGHLKHIMEVIPTMEELSKKLNELEETLLWQSRN